MGGTARSRSHDDAERFHRLGRGRTEHDDSGLDAPLVTGTDTSAGAITRMLTFVILPFLATWELSRRVVRRGRALGSGAGPLVSGAVCRLGRLLAGGSHRAATVLKPLGDALRASGQGLLVLGHAATGMARTIAKPIGAWWHALTRWTARWTSVALALAAAAAVPLGRLLRRVTVGAGRIVARLWWLLAVGRRGAIGWVGPPLVGSMRALWTVVVVASTVAVGAARAGLALVGAPMAAAGRLLGRAMALAAAVLIAGLRAFARSVTAAARGLARLLAVVARLVAPCLAVVAGRIDHAARGLGRLLAVVARLVTGGVRVVAEGAAKDLAFAAARAAAALAVIGRPIARAIRWVVRSLASGLDAAARSTARTCVRVLSGPLRAGWATSAPPARWVKRWTIRIFETVGRVPESVATIGRSASGRVAQDSLVAFGTARHLARRGPGTGIDSDSGPVIDPGGPRHREEQMLVSDFTAETSQNEYLPPGGSEVNAIVSVTSDVGAVEGRAPEAVVVFLLDCSASMGHPWEKIRSLRRATCAALETLGDGVWFAVVRGDETAQIAFPPGNGLVQASPETRRQAAAAVGRLQPVGGTAIGRWLRVAARLADLCPGAIPRVILLTDGKDENETEDELDAALDACRGRLQCDCRGIGSDWAVSELRKVSSALLGTVDIIRQPADMEDDFRALSAAATAPRIEATLRVWTPERARIRYIRQVSPHIEDMTSRLRRIDPHRVECPTGAWTTERRAFHVSVDVPPGPMGAEMLAARVSVAVGDRELAQARVRAIWSDDPSLSAPLCADVAHYSGQAELAQVIQEGLAARRVGDERTATRQLGRAVQLAAQSGNDATSALLSHLVQVEDAATGTVHLKAHVEAADEMTLDARSTQTTRVTARSSVQDR
ncbi:MAG: VWA domain-containing protein [Acidimicrobiales bacterium]